MQPELAGAVRWAEKMHTAPHEAVAVIDQQLVVRHWNAVAEGLTGLSRHAVLGRELLEVVPQLRIGEALEPIRAALRGEFRTANAFFPRGKEQVELSPVAGTAGVAGVLAVHRSQSAAHDLEERLRETEQRFRTMADNAPVLLWMSGTDAMCDFFNGTWREFTGRTMEQEAGVGWIEGVHAVDFQRCMDTYMDAFSERRPFAMEYRLRRHDGEYRWVLDCGAPRYGTDGTFQGYIGSLVDITDRIASEAALRETADELRRSNDHLERFAFAASHDLQTPLRGIRYLLEWLREDLGEAEAQVADHLDKLDERAGRMKAQLEGLLAYAQSGQPRMKLEEVDVGELTRSVAGDLFQEGMRIEVDDGLPVLTTVRAPLLQVIQNVLGNAVTHHDRDEGRVVVGAVQIGDRWHFTVEDDGPGIPEEAHERVFQLFATLTRKDEGGRHGLGLALARRSVEAAGCTISIESPLDGRRGTRVRFAWPVTWPEGRSA